MAHIDKTNGTITITGSDGRITGNIAGSALNGPCAGATLQMDAPEWAQAKDTDHWSYQAALDTMLNTPEGSTMVHVDDVPAGYYAVEYWTEEPDSQEPQLGVIVGPFPTISDGLDWSAYDFTPDPDTFDDMVVTPASDLRDLTDSKFIIITSPNTGR